jgi:hypothetical protein
MDFAYLGLTHEISHRLDVSKAGSTYEWYLSEQWDKGFAPLSGWREVSATVDGKTTTKWESGWTRSGSGGSLTWSKSAEIDEFVRDYAGSSPMEDFADTIAYFRSNPEWTRTKSPRKYEWIAANIHGGRKFEPDARKSRYLEQSKLVVESRLPAAVDQCLEAPATGTQSAGQESEEWSRSVGGAFAVPGESGALVKTCIDARIHQLIGSQLAEFKRTEFEACDDINSDSERGIRQAVMSLVESKVPDLIARNAALAPIVKAQKELRGRLARELDPREAFLKCSSNAEAQSCYAESVKGAFDRIAQNYLATLGESTLATEWEMYRSGWDFDQARAKFNEAWEKLTLGLRDEVAAAAVARWESCRGEAYPSRGVHALLEREGAADLIAPLMVPFSGGIEYIDLRDLHA